MQENQNTEWKESWRDEYIKWIAGFANASGGKLFIGIDDTGKVSGIDDAQKLLEDIPNKVRDILGIVVDVNLLGSSSEQYLEIIVEAYSNAVSYKGQYHYRSGSTKQELKGGALDRFLLQKHGKRWDSVPVPRVSIKDLSVSAFDFFRKKAIESNRLSKDILKDDNEALLEKLHLTEGNYLKRAAILLFHPDPEKFITGAFIKIGFFRTDTDLLFQDEINGHLFEQIEKTLDLLFTKYLKAFVSYKGIQRLERLILPEIALREAVLNAIAHKDYSSGVPIQISVYADKVIIWNEGILPETWTIESLSQKHASRPYNPAISTAFFRTGYIEQWGRGTINIIDACLDYGIPAPVYSYDSTSLTLEIRQGENEMSGEMSGKMSGKIIEMINENANITIPEIATVLGVTERTVERAINKLRTENKIERIGAKKGGYWQVITKQKE